MRRVIKPIILAIVLLVFFATCSLSKKMTVDNYTSINAPPGTKELAINFYCDETEATNQYWLDFLHWIKIVYGANSEEYKLAMPDTTIWKMIYPDSIARDLSCYYLRYPGYRNLPVVGVSQQQTKEYAKWRSDRVLEQILITLGIIEISKKPTKDNHFTIERYFNGEIKKLKDVNIAYYPEYRLPNIQERQYIITSIDYLDYFDYNKTNIPRRHKKHDEKSLDHFPFIWSDVSVEQDTSFNLRGLRYEMYEMKKNRVPPMIMAQIYSGSYIYHLRGNVAEWLDEPNISAGGSWHDKLEDILASDTSSCNKANAWTGFRCVCQWKKWENKNE